VLRVAAASAEYGARQLADGLSPAEARRAAVEAAGELEATAAALRRLARLSGPQRRAVARSLAGLGWSRREIAVRLGVSDRTVFGYLRGR
jgi:DNA-directed RNA polymerase specialized sigma24 family protein